MDLATPLVTGVLLALFTGIQLWIGRGRFDALGGRIDALGGRIDALEERMDRRFEQISAEIAALRSDLLQVALAATGKREAT